MRARIWPLIQDHFHQHHSKITPLKRIKKSFFNFTLKICLLTCQSHVAKLLSELFLILNKHVKLDLWVMWHLLLCLKFQIHYFKYSEDPNTGNSNFGTIPLTDYVIVGSPCPIKVHYSSHDLNAIQKVRYLDVFNLHSDPTIH